MKERLEFYRNEIITQFEKNNICENDRIVILEKYLRKLMKNIGVLSEKMEIGNLLKDTDNEIINSMNEITEKIIVVTKLKKELEFEQYYKRI